MTMLIHCLVCGAKEQEEAATQKCEYHSWFVKGFAKHPYLCDSCNTDIDRGTKCQTTTHYTDDTGYTPWEGDYLDGMGKGTSGVARCSKESTPQMKVLTVFACRRRARGFRWKIPEIEMVGYGYGPFETLEEEIYDQFSCYKWLGKEFEHDLQKRGTYSFDIHLVGAAEVGPVDVDLEYGDEIWVD
jgi:hypothetical protein